MTEEPKEPMIRIEWNIQGHRGSTPWQPEGEFAILQYWIISANQIHGRGTHWIAKQEPKS